MAGVKKKDSTRNLFQFQLLDDFTRKQIEIKEEAEPVSDNEPEDKPSEDEEEEEEDPLPDDPIPDPDQPQEPDGIAQTTEDLGSKAADEEDQKAEDEDEVNPAGLATNSIYVCLLFVKQSSICLKGKPLGRRSFSFVPYNICLFWGLCCYNAKR